MPRRPSADPVAAKVGARIRDLRFERGLSLAALADASGLSKGHMSSVERGLVLITVGTVVAAARALNMPPFLLMMFPEEEPFAAVVEHVRLGEGGDSIKTAEKLRQLVFGWENGLAGASVDEEAPVSEPPSPLPPAKGRRAKRKR